jgi:hypothetical protein
MPQICMAACLPLFYTPACRSNTCNSAFQTENAGIENREYETRPENFLTPKLARDLCKITSFTPATLTELKGRDDIPFLLEGGSFFQNRTALKMGWGRRKIRLIECNAKCRYLKKFTCKGTLLQVFYLSEAPSPPMTPYYPPYTLYTCTIYSILIHTGKGGEGVELTREKATGRKCFTKPVENTNMTDCYLQSINSIKHQ